MLSLIGLHKILFTDSVQRELQNIAGRVNASIVVIRF